MNVLQYNKIYSIIMALNNNIIPSACVEEERGAEFLQQRIQPRVLSTLNCHLQGNLAESKPVDVQREFTEGLALEITKEVITVINLLGYDRRLTPTDGPVDPGLPAKEEQDEEGASPSGSTEEEGTDSEGTQTSSGPCDTWYEFIQPERRAVDAAEDSVDVSDTENQEDTSVESVEVVDESSCCPRLRKLCISARKRMRKLIGRAARIFRRRVAPSTVRDDVLPSPATSVSLGLLPSNLQDRGSTVSPRSASLSDMGRGPVQEYLHVRSHLEEAGNERPLPLHIVDFIQGPFTEESVMGLMEFLMSVELAHPRYRRQTATVAEVYAQLLRMVGTLENLQRIAEQRNRDFYYLITDSVMRTVFNIPPSSQLYWGCPEGFRLPMEIPHSWDREPVVEAEGQLPLGQEGQEGEGGGPPVSSDSSESEIDFWW
ncbi:uncharacterized protein [Hoplias malabaricus]|uniref:uncharacterized protein isoform X1 n=1 Tax=Hoplias malabaricus TaxID=27720 RepID=UPI003461CEE9